MKTKYLIPTINFYSCTLYNVLSYVLIFSQPAPWLVFWLEMIEVILVFYVIKKVNTEGRGREEGGGGIGSEGEKCLMCWATCGKLLSHILVVCSSSNSFHTSYSSPSFLLPHPPISYPSICCCDEPWPGQEM